MKDTLEVKVSCTTCGMVFEDVKGSMGHECMRVKSLVEYLADALLEAATHDHDTFVSVSRLLMREHGLEVYNAAFDLFEATDFA